MPAWLARILGRAKPPPRPIVVVVLQGPGAVPGRVIEIRKKVTHG